MLTDQSTIDVIKKSRKLVTILFSDIEESTRHWERRGDIDARLLIDRHNRLLFPIIRKYKGRIIKTLGDAIMASFSDPQLAIKASIAMQQALKLEREKDEYFSVRIRIGVHTGKGIVENDDVYGDVVNVAAKVQGEAEANQIVLTSSTVARLPKETFAFDEADSIKLKGKRKPIKIYICDWEKCDNFVGNIKPDALTPLLKAQKLELMTYMAVCLFALFFIYERYLRYLLTDSGLTSPYSEGAGHLPSGFLTVAILLLCLLIAAYIYLRRINFISRTVPRILSGCFGYSIILLAFHGLNTYTEPPFKQLWYGSIFQTNTLFVEVINDNTPLKEKPDIYSKTLAALPKGEIFIYQSSIKKQSRRWDKVNLNKNQTAWIPRKIPPAFGVAEQQLTMTHAFSFYLYDLYALIISVFGFIWGYINFKIRIT